MAALAAGAVVVVTSGDQVDGPAADERGEDGADESGSGAGTRSGDTASSGPTAANGDPTAGGAATDRRPQASSSIGMADEVPPPARWPLESGLSLVALAEDGSIVTIDVDAGDRLVRAGRAVDRTRPAYVVPDRDGVSVVGHDPSESYRLTRDGVLRATRRPLDGPLFPGPDPGTAWRLAPTTGDATDSDYELVDADGIPLGPRLDLGVGDVLGGDGRGGLLVRTRDRIVVAADVGGEELITNGVVVAAGPGAAWVRECTLQECRLVRVDRSGGDRETIDLDAGLAVPARGLVGVSRAPIGPMGQTVSPDGDVALVRRSPASTEWLMIDLAAGRATLVPEPAPGAPVVWTDDSRYAVWLSAGTMRVFDRTAAGYVDVQGTPALRAFGELPASRRDPPSAGGYPRRIADFADPAHGVPAVASGPRRSAGAGVLRGVRRLPAATIPPPFETGLVLATLAVDGTMATLDVDEDVRTARSGSPRAFVPTLRSPAGARPPLAVDARRVRGDDVPTPVRVAVGVSVLWARDCVREGCHLVRVERRSGEHRRLELAAGLGVRAESLVGRREDGPIGRTVSPDGDAALVRRALAQPSTIPTEWLLIDLAAERAREVPAPDAGSPVVWTDDGRYAVWLSAGRLRVYDRVAAGYADVGGSAELRTFAPLRPRAAARPRGGHGDRW